MVETIEAVREETTPAVARPRLKTTYSSREFNQQVGQAKKAAEFGPVFITDRGVPTHVLLSMEEYRRITTKPMTLAEMVGDPRAVEGDDLEIPPRTVWPLRELDLD